jgi:PAXNEB protein
LFTESSKNIQLQRSGLSTSSSSVSQRTSAVASSSVYCHSYDLAGRLVDQIDALSFVRLLPIIPQPGCSTHRQAGFNMFKSVATQLENLIAEKPNKVIRVMFNRPSNVKSFGVMLPLLMTFIRQRKLPIVVLVYTQPWTFDDNTSTLQLERCCDVVLRVEGFASRREFPPPAEFRMLHGLLHIIKVSTCTSSLGHFADLTITKRPAAYLYGLRRDRRKLNIQLLHIPPEDYAAGGSSVGGGGVRSSAGRTSTNDTKKSILDF